MGFPFIYINFVQYFVIVQNSIAVFLSNSMNVRINSMNVRIHSYSRVLCDGVVFRLLFCLHPVK